MNTTQNGGMTRVTMGEQPASAKFLQAAPFEANHVAAGVTKFAIGVPGSPSELVQTGVTKHNTFFDQQANNVMGTLLRVNGGDTVELIPGVPGSRTHIRQALKDGLIVPMGNGEYQNAPTQQQQLAAAPKAATQGQSQGVPPVAGDPGAGVFNPVDDENWNAAIEPLPQSSFDSASASVTAAILSGGNFDRAAMQLAESAGIAPTLAAEYVQAGYDMHERIVAKEAASLGVSDKAGFYGWMQEHKGRALQNAIQSLATARNVQPFRILALEYTRYSSEQATKMRPR